MACNLSLTDFDPIVAEVQAKTLAVDFGLYLNTGVTLVGPADVAISVVSGEDATPQARLTSGPDIDTLSEADHGTGIVDAALFFQLSDLQPGTKYLLVYTCLASNGDTVAAFNHIKTVTPH